MKRIRLNVLVAAGFLFLLVSNNVFAADGAVTRRFGLFIGSNNGGRERTILRYAVSDARSVSRVFTGMGGIAEEDNIILVEPTVADINRQLDNLGRISAQAQRNSQRTELVFYFSGHSDEDGIFLNRERYGYRELRERINTVQSEMKIVILDSCSSGAITRAKGGVKTQPFLFDTSVSAAGYAFLTSSSDEEASQESDSIGSSYFTHSLLAGLRGAADSVGDGRVTLNELYRYAYSETLAKTETSLYGPQHPSYDIQISGSGDVVLTDIKEISASLVIAEDITGRISIRDSSDFLVAELTKVSNKPMVLGLEPGLYRITVQTGGNNFYRAEVNLPENRQTILNRSNLTIFAAAAGDRRRGNEFDSDYDFNENDEERSYLFSFQFLPGFDGSWIKGKNTTHNFVFGLFGGMSHNINGVGVSPIGLINTGNVNGAQVSGIFNITEGWGHGVQAAGIFNITNGERTGVQTAAIFNIAKESVIGAQTAGIFNFADGSLIGLQASGIHSFANGDVRGIQTSGIYNIASGEVTGIQAAGIFNKAGEINGGQIAGLVNYNSGGRGAMIGLVNISKSEDVIPVGLVNVVKNGILHPAVYVDDMLFTNISFRSGNRYFYSFISTGIGGSSTFNNSATQFVLRGGFGVEFTLNKLFFNLDISSGTIFNLEAVEEDTDYYGNWTLNIDSSSVGIAQLRFTTGYRIFKHLGVFGGLSYDFIYKHSDVNRENDDFNDPLIGFSNDRHMHKLGIFAGIQF